MILNRQRRASVDEDDLDIFASRLAKSLRLAPDSFSLVLVSDRRMQELNRRYRNNPRATDVLSFPAGRNGYLGDILVSVETAQRQARRYRHGLGAEIKLLFLHGLLHLLGYDHETDQGQMVRREHALRRRLKLE